MGLREVLRIARWEVTKNAGGVDRRTVAIAAVALVLAGAVAPLAAGQGLELDAGLYRVGVDEDSPYYGPVATDPTFTVEPPDAADLDLLVEGRRIRYADTAKGRAALEELGETVERYNDRQMAREDNQTAAFPVAVTLEYVEREGVRDVVAPGAAGTDGGSAGDSGTADSTSGDGTTGGTTGGSTDVQGGTDRDAGSADSLGGGALAGGLGGQGTSGTPSDIAPPFPFESLVLAFVFVLPLNFLIQAYGSTVLSERLNRRGELLLVAPVSRFDIIGGKTLPYFGAALAVEGAIAVGLTWLQTGQVGGLLSVLAVTPLALLFLAATFLGAMFARSFKELTFVTVTVTVSLTSYAFVPAIFTDVGSIALISPLTLVVRDLQGQAVGVGEFAFSTLPPFLSALVLFGLGAGLYREEDMFTQRPIPLKVLDALAGYVRGTWSVAALSALLLPFVFVAELLAVATLFALPLGASIPVILVAVAAIEEVAKSLHVYAGYVHARFDRSLATAVSVGVASGVGFFVGEKLTLLAQLVGLPELRLGEAALATGTGVSTVPMVVALLLAPLALHATTATVSAVGASRGRRGYAVALLAAVAVHTAYNLTVVVVLA